MAERSKARDSSVSNTSGRFKRLVHSRIERCGGSNPPLFILLGIQILHIYTSLTNYHRSDSRWAPRDQSWTGLLDEDLALDAVHAMGVIVSTPPPAVALTI